MISITKAKLLKGDKVEVGYTRRNKNMKDSTVNEEHQDPPHQDLRDAFSKLAVHAALISEFIKEVDDIEEPDQEVISDYTVTGYTMTGKDDDPGVILTATKTLKTGKVMMFNTPVIREQEVSNPYEYVDELFAAVAHCNTEVKRYLDGHHAPDAQQELPFVEEKVTKLQVLPEEKAVFGKYPSDANTGDSSPSVVVADTGAGKVEIPVKRGRKKAQTPDNPSGN